MKNRGYTLLEVLGVIIILALLTMVVFPSVINFIKKSSDEIDEYSMKLISNAADLYVKARKDSYIEYNDNKYIIEMQDLIDEGKLPDSLKISDIDNIKDKCIQVEYKGYKFNYELKDKGTCEQFMHFNSICTLASDSTVTGLNAGAKYNCKVDPNRDSYKFYVLTTPTSTDEYVNLIMDQNINSDGTPAGMAEVKQDDNPSQYSLVEWNSESDDDKKAGPVTAMQFLYNATKSWTNVPALNYEYNDREYQGIITDHAHAIYYTLFISTNGVANIIPLTGAATPIGTLEIPLRARMPIYTENETNLSKNEVAALKEDNSNAYLYDNLRINDVGAPGYWTFSLNKILFVPLAFCVDYGGTVKNNGVTTNGGYGVRPVISLKIQPLQTIDK